MSELKLEEELDEDSTFSQKIEDNATICKNCYRKVKSYSEPHHTMPDAVSLLVEHEKHVDHYWVDDRENSGRPNVKRSACECGDMDGAKLRPFDNREVMEVAQRIESHLDEMDVDIDKDEYYSYIRNNRDGSDIHFNEEKYFENAIERSLITEDE